jgi:hypothetical protein
VALEEQDEDQISEDSEDYSQAKVYHVGETEESVDESPISKDEESQLALDSINEIEDDDGDSDWEDLDSDEESSEYGDEYGDGDGIYFEIEEEASFIVFGDD